MENIFLFPLIAFYVNHKKEILSRQLRVFRLGKPKDKDNTRAWISTNSAARNPIKCSCLLSFKVFYLNHNNTVPLFIRFELKIRGWLVCFFSQFSLSLSKWLVTEERIVHAWLSLLYQFLIYTVLCMAPTFLLLVLRTFLLVCFHYA